MHLNASSEYNMTKGEDTFNCLSYLVNTENPDFIVMTGDITSGRPCKENAGSSFRFVKSLQNTILLCTG